MDYGAPLIARYLLEELRALGHIDREHIFEGERTDYVVEVRCFPIPKEVN